MSNKPSPNGIYAWYAVAVLMICYTFSFVDRQILNLMIGPMRQDFNLSDTQVSLLIGFAFALFYTLMGLPLGRLADRVSRKHLIMAGLAVWSLATVCCGFARSFGQLFLLRMSVGVGEAALNPCAYSIISDSFSKEKLGKAISVYALGINLGVGIAFLFGGAVMGSAGDLGDTGIALIDALSPWQLALICAGLPGVIIVPLVWSIREPERKNVLTKNGETLKSVPVSEVVRFILQRKQTFVPLFAGGAIMSIMGYGFLAWTPEFFIRVFGWTAAESGARIGLAVLLLSTTGIYAAGALADRLVAKGETDGYLRILVWSGLILTPPCILMPLMPAAGPAFILLLPIVLLFTCPYGVLPASIQVISPNQLRGQISALYMFFNNIIGLGLGPTIVALITDRVFADDMALGYSLAIVLGLTAPLAALCFHICRGPFRSSVEQAQQWSTAGQSA